MKVIERPWKYGMQLAYTEVEPDLTDFGNPKYGKHVRVLPARYYYDKKLYFEFFRQYAPGEHKYFPNGGFHVRDVNGAGYYFDLDQVIIHPNIIEQERQTIKRKRKYEKTEAERLKRDKSLSTPGGKGSGKRGRPALSFEEKQLRDKDKADKRERSGGKRGRPSKGEVREPKVYVPKGTGRGRPPLDPALKAQREADAAKRLAANNGVKGKRGRPSNPGKQKERDEEAARRLALNPLKRRGRPPRS